MEHWMNVPGRRETQLVGHREHHLLHQKGAVASGSQFGSQLTGAEIASFQPHRVPFMILGRVPMFHPHQLGPGHRLLRLGPYLL